MREKHFANTGQILQLLVTSVGTIIAGINAYPSIKSWDFTNVWPVLFYLLVAALVIAILNLSRSKSATASVPTPTSIEATPNYAAIYVDQKAITDLLPATASRYKTAAATQKITLKLGERWTYGSGGEAIRIILHKLDTTGSEVRADITVDTFRSVFGGDLTVKSKDDLYRFLVPVPVGNPTRSSLFSFMVPETFLHLDAVTVTHINVHSGEVELTIVRVIGAAVETAKP
jgi:hypothetical protein